MNLLLIEPMSSMISSTVEPSQAAAGATGTESGHRSGQHQQQCDWRSVLPGLLWGAALYLPSQAGELASDRLPLLPV